MATIVDLLVDRDEFDIILSYVEDNYMFSLALTCKAFYNKIHQPFRTTYASLASSASLIEWGVKNNCSIETKIWLEEASMLGNLDVLCWLDSTYDYDLEHTDVVENAALSGHIHVLEWMLSKNKDLSYAYTYAAIGGHINVLNWAVQNAIRIGESGDNGDKACVCNAAAMSGRRDVLEWLRCNGFRWCSFTVAGAAAGGHLDIIQWLIAEGCDWTSSIYTEATKGGHLRVVKWAYEGGIRAFRYDIYGCALKEGHLELAEWARLNIIN